MLEQEQFKNENQRRLRASDVLGAMAVASGVFSGLLGLDAVVSSAMMLDYRRQLEYAVVYASVSAGGIATSALLASREK